ncbi:acyl-CoA dehydrogenase family protein [Alicyclobacillus dauci]|uniref:Acyl-CoA dehydrogenase n=1 Tax=Alicyclobacillus dauci TaxID=1475485 RepID=A0ABY6Z0U1_9BACL|nr:acyl-CoA dehydrogenase [Alicyclobacillus dauci]WAH36208.1 acyl-CoA dehydrogenase [Alicyclobacillus dauci]
MDFYLNNQETEYRTMVTNYAREVLSVERDRIDGQGELQEGDISNLVTAGLWGEHFFTNTNWTTKVTTLIELAKESPSLAGFLVDSLAAASLCSNESGQDRTVLALVEEQAGSDFQSMSTVASRTSDGWVINGDKCFVTNASITSAFVVFAKVDNKPAVFVVESRTPGVAIQSEQSKMGLNGLRFFNVSFQNVAVPETAYVAVESEEVMQKVFSYLALGMGALSIGIAEAAFNLALDRARARQQFGKPIGDNQAVQFMVAKMVVKINAAKSMLYRATQRLDVGEAPGASANAAKLMASEACRDVVHHALQIYGGHGLLSEHRISQLYQDQRITELFGGTSETQRNAISKYVIEELYA